MIYLVLKNRPYIINRVTLRRNKQVKVEQLKTYFKNTTRSYGWRLKGKMFSVFWHVYNWCAFSIYIKPFNSNKCSDNSVCEKTSLKHLCRSAVQNSNNCCKKMSKESFKNMGAFYNKMVVKDNYRIWTNQKSLITSSNTKRKRHRSLSSTLLLYTFGLIYSLLIIPSVYGKIIFN